MKLFISTATDKIYLMTFTDEMIIEKKVFQGKNNHTETLYKLIEEMNINFDELTQIYVVNGPGSYTGLRVGVIYAKTVAMLKGVEVIPVGLMPALYSANNEETVCVDAKGKKYYTYSGTEVTLVKADEVTGHIDPELDLDQLFASKYLETLESVNYLELTIEYIKSAI